MVSPPTVILLCGDCGVFPAAGGPYKSMPTKGAYDHVAENPGHAVAVYIFSVVVEEGK